MLIQMLWGMVAFLWVSLCDASDFKTVMGRDEVFLGTMGGEEIVVKCPFTGKNVYGRQFTLFGPKNIRKDLSTWNLKEYEERGDSYSYTPLCLRDGRPFGTKQTTGHEGGFFLILNPAEDSKEYLWPSQYALRTFGEKLENLSGKPMKDLLWECKKYGLEYILTQYFKPTLKPEDGDLTVYTSTTQDWGKVLHAGVFRDSTPNWRSPYGGTVESKISYVSPNIYQTDMFFFPESFGDVALFYRLRSSPKEIYRFPTQENFDLLKEGFHDAGDGYFKIREEDQDIREKIENTRTEDLLRQFPEIVKLPISMTGLCYDYAYLKILDACSIRRPAMPSDEEIKELFEETMHPEKGDLIAYYAYKGGYGQKHYGVYLGDGYVESKWGSEWVLIHPISYVPTRYGSYIKFWHPRIKEK